MDDLGGKSVSSSAQICQKRSPCNDRGAFFLSPVQRPYCKSMNSYKCQLGIQDWCFLFRWESSVASHDDYGGNLYSLDRWNKSEIFGQFMMISNLRVFFGGGSWGMVFVKGIVCSSRLFSERFFLVNVLGGIPCSSNLGGGFKKFWISPLFVDFQMIETTNYSHFWIFAPRNSHSLISLPLNGCVGQGPIF